MKLTTDIIETICEKLINSKTEDAIETLDNFNIDYRMICVDGEHMMATMDYDPSRINLSVEGGIVISAEIG